MGGRMCKNISRNSSDKYRQKSLDKKSTIGALKTASKRAIQKTVKTMKNGLMENINAKRHIQNDEATYFDSFIMNIFQKRFKKL